MLDGLYRRQVGKKLAGAEFALRGEGTDSETTRDSMEIRAETTTQRQAKTLDFFDTKLPNNSHLPRHRSNPSANAISENINDTESRSGFLRTLPAVHCDSTLADALQCDKLFS